MLSANLKADDREFEYLMIILNVKVDASKKLLDFEFKSEMEEESPLPELISESKMDYYNNLDTVMLKTKTEMNFSFTMIPSNFLDLYKHFFYSTCKLCTQPGVLAVCLLCGDAICRRFCKKEGHNDDDRRQLLIQPGTPPFTVSNTTVAYVLSSIHRTGTYSTTSSRSSI